MGVYEDLLRRKKILEDEQGNITVNSVVDKNIRNKLTDNNIQTYKETQESNNQAISQMKNTIKRSARSTIWEQMQSLMGNKPITSSKFVNNFKDNLISNISKKDDNKNKNLIDDAKGLFKLTGLGASTGAKQTLNYIENANENNFSNYKDLKNTQFLTSKNVSEEDKAKAKIQNNLLLQMNGINTDKTIETNLTKKAINESIEKDNQKIQEEQSKMNNVVTEKLGEIAPSIGQQIPGIVASSVNPILGASYFTTSAGGNYIDDAKQRGMTDEQAFKYGTIMGAIEGSLEAVGTKLTTNVGKNLLKKNIKGALVNYGLDIGENFLEEAIVEPISELVLQTSAGKEKANWSNILKRMWDSGVNGALVSAITGGASGLTGGVASNFQNNKYTNNTLNLQPQSTQTRQILPTQQITQQENEVAQNENIEQRNMLPIQNYIYEKSDNLKIDNLRQDVSKYWDNSEKTKNYVNMLEKIIQDKDIDIRLDANLTDSKGNIANGSYSNGVITINPNSTRAGEFIAIHELTHAIGTGQMRNIVQKYRESNAEFDTAVKSLLQNYNTTELTEEAMSDVAGQLFGNQEFINNLAQTEPSLFQKIYNEIKYLWHQFTGYKNQDQFINDLQYKWEQAYRSNAKLNETTNYSIQRNNNGKYIKVDTDQDIFNGIEEKDYNKIAKMYMQDYLKGNTKLSESDNATIGSKGINKYTNPKQQTKYMNEKMKLTPELKNVLEIAKKVQDSPPTKDTSKYPNWEYYKFNFELGGKNFEGLINIGIDKNGNKHFYEINKIHTTSNSYVSTNKSSSTDSINNSILPTQENVNTTKYSIQESENNSGSFSFDKNAKRYADLLLSNTINYNKRNNGTLNIEMVNDNELINQISVDTKEETIKQLGDNIGSYIYESANGESKSLSLNQQEKSKQKPVTHKEKQLDIIKNANPMLDDYHTGIRNVEDIKTFKETIEDGESFAWGDFSKEDAKKALKEGEITIYSSYPIKQGTFISTSKIQAEEYAGGRGKRVYSKTIPLDEVAWINGDEGQYAKVDKKYSLPTKEWQQHLEKNYKSKGTITNLEDIKLPAQETSQEASINLPTEAEKIDWNDIERPEGKIRKHYRSVIESSNTTKEAKAIAKEMMGTDTYVPDSNNKQLERANERIESSTPDSELNSLMSRAKTGGKIDATDIAVGERLIQYYSLVGDKVKLQDAIQATAMAGTTAGQTVQAMSLLNHQTPEGQAIWLQRSVEKMNNDLKKNRGEKAQQFDLTPEMVDKVVKSKNNEELNNNLNEVYKELGQQVSKTTLQKVDSWRYFSMLANPRTHIRNIIGNTAMGKTQGIKNKIAGSIEGVVSKINPDMERTHTILPSSKEIKEFAKNDIKNVADRLGLNENKYNPKTRLESSMRTFKSDAIENTIGKLFDANSKLLEAEDAFGLKSAYRKALSEYMTANKLKPDNITDKQLAKARNYAVEQAQEATFHQASSLATLINQLGNKNKFAKYALDATLPFKKTPINVAKSGIEYSPVGLAKSIIYDSVQLRKGNITVNKYIDNISKGLTGTGIALVGYALANAGILKASGSDDKEGEKFDEEMGNQTYSIKIGDNTYSLDWLAPTGIPLFIGAETFEIMQTENEEKESSSDEDSKYNRAIKTATNLLDASANAMNPMTEMSMLSGLTSALKSYEQGSSQMLASLLTNSAKSYVNQFVPTALGQVAKTTDKYERSTTSTKSGILPRAIDTTKNQIMNKVPGLRQMLPTKTDIWGNDIKQSDNVMQRAFENTIAPYTRKEISSDKVNKELSALYKNIGESSILPSTIEKTFTINSEKYRMTNEEYSKYKENYGKTSYKLLNELINSRDYKNMTNVQRQKAIESVYSYAKESNKIDYAKSNNLEVEKSTVYTTMEELKKNGGSQSQYLNYIGKTVDIEKDREKNQILSNSNYTNKTKTIIYTNTTGKDDNLYNITLKNSNIDIDEYLDYKIKESKEEFSADKDSNGNSISGTSKKKYYNYINSNITDRGSRLIILGSKYKLSNSERYQLSDYINKISSNNEEAIQTFEYLSKNYVVKGGKVYYK